MGDLSHKTLLFGIKLVNSLLYFALVYPQYVRNFQDLLKLAIISDLLQHDDH